MILADIISLWNGAWPAGATMLLLGLGFAIVLLIANEKLKVLQDERVEKILAVLPNINCGSCGCAGCQEYAKAVVADATLLGRCFPGGAKTMHDVAAVLNLRISESNAPKRPIVHCRAHTGDKAVYAKYQGIPTCTSANALVNVQACKFGCLSFGDCVAACKFDALATVDGLATVNYVKCTGCGACAKACPRNLIDMVSFTCENMMTVACKSKESGKVTRSMCKVGCIGCGLCAKQTAIFTVEENLARLDYSKFQPNEQTKAAMEKCPTCVIVYRGPTAPLPRQPSQKPAAAIA
ncbi:MAG: RnfABCDGE type electron transport complex subunit B [Phycisphaerae bacterium]|jgi:RnfABCDGE-type electron transport complex B subunit